MPTLEMRSSYLASIVQYSQDAILGISSSGEIIYWNPAAERLYGYSASDAIGQSVSILSPAGKIDRLVKLLPRALAGEQIGPIDTVHENDQRELVPLSVTLSPIKSSSGNIVGTCAILRDISEKKKTELQLRKLSSELEQKNSLLEQKNQELEQFVYSISHDLKSPLVTIKGFLGLLKEDIKTTNASSLALVFDSIERIERSVEYMSQLIMDLLGFSRVSLDSSKFEIVSGSEVKSTLLERFRNRFAGASIALDIQPLPDIYGQELQILRVLENLLENAFRHGSGNEHPKVTITGGSAVTGVYITVIDNGSGIQHDYQERIFGIFQQLDPSKGGTGVGLAIVSKIMQLHGGSVSLTSNPGEGSHFQLFFPSPAKINPDPAALEETK